MSPVTAAALWVLPLLIAWLWRPRQAAGPSAWILLIAFGALGAWALWFGLYAHPGEPAGFAFWKPTVLYWTLAAIMIMAPLLGWGTETRAREVADYRARVDAERASQVRFDDDSAQEVRTAAPEVRAFLSAVAKDSS